MLLKNSSLNFSLNISSFSYFFIKYVVTNIDIPPITSQIFENIIGIFKPKTLQDKKFRYYFRTKYRRLDIKKRIKKEGIFVFRDPYDAHYNPGQSLKESHEDIFYQKLKKVYYKLMETGCLKDINQSE